MKRDYVHVFAMVSLAVVLGCQTPEIHTQSEKLDPHRNRPVQITSADPILVDLICQRLLCGPGPVLDIHLTIQETSSDLIRNNALSLLTLTTGLFVTHSALVEYSFELDMNPIETRKGTVFIRDGYWFVLPFYAGIGGTNLGTALNGYRDPAHLQHYCLEETPGTLRQFMDGSRDDICREYRRFLSVTLVSLWKELDPLLYRIPDDADLDRLSEGGF